MKKYLNGCVIFALAALLGFVSGKFYADYSNVKLAWTADVAEIILEITLKKKTIERIEKGEYQEAIADLEGYIDMHVSVGSVITGDPNLVGELATEKFRYIKDEWKERNDK